jgi:hypothetical protein
LNAKSICLTNFNTSLQLTASSFLLLLGNYTCFNDLCWYGIQIQAAFRTDEIRRSQPTPQDEMRAGMSYFHETIWNGLPKFLRRVDTALKAIGVKERLPHNVPLIQFSSWMGGDRDGNVHTHCCFFFLFFLFFFFKKNNLIGCEH